MSSCRPAAPGVVIPEDLSFMGDAKAHKAEKAKRERESEREREVVDGVAKSLSF